MHRPLLLSLSLVLVLGACGHADEQQAQKLKQQGRTETRGIRNTQNIGVSGAAIADKVDAALDANERHAKELREADPAAATTESAP